MMDANIGFWIGMANIGFCAACLIDGYDVHGAEEDARGHNLCFEVFRTCAFFKIRPVDGRAKMLVDEFLVLRSLRPLHSSKIEGWEFHFILMAKNVTRE